MKFYRTGTFKDDVLEKLVEINPSEQIQPFFLNRLNYLIGFLHEKNPDYLENFVSGLVARYTELVETDSLSEKKMDLDALILDHKNMQTYTNLAALAINHYIQILGITEGSAWNNTIKVTNRDFHRAFLLPRYYNLTTLIETMGREKAIRLYKIFFTQYLIDNRKPRDPPFVDLDSMVEEKIKKLEEDSDWVTVWGMLEDGKYAYRNDNCLWADSLDDVSDLEVKYLICCYGDYEGARRFYNDSIIMTMEHTIAQGDPYCSRVLHDTRVDYNLKHPPKEFWDSLDDKIENTS